jgi:hypothetical protein
LCCVNTFVCARAPTAKNNNIESITAKCDRRDFKKIAVLLKRFFTELFANERIANRDIAGYFI